MGEEGTCDGNPLIEKPLLKGHRGSTEARLQVGCQYGISMIIKNRMRALACVLHAVPGVCTAISSNGGRGGRNGAT